MIQDLFVFLLHHFSVGAQELVHFVVLEGVLLGLLFVERPGVVHLLQLVLLHELHLELVTVQLPSLQLLRLDVLFLLVVSLLDLFEVFGLFHFSHDHLGLQGAADLIRVFILHILLELLDLLLPLHLPAVVHTDARQTLIVVLHLVN